MKIHSDPNEDNEVFKTFTDLIFCVLLIFILLVTVLAVTLRSEPDLIKNKPVVEKHQEKPPEADERIQQLTKRIERQEQTIEQQNREIRQRDRTLEQTRQTLSRRQQQPPRKQLLSYHVGTSNITVQANAQSEQNVQLTLPGYGKISWEDWLSFASHFWGSEGFSIKYDVGSVGNVLQPFRNHMLKQVSPEEFREIIQSDKQFDRYAKPYLTSILRRDFTRSLRKKRPALKDILEWNGRHTLGLEGEQIEQHRRYHLQKYLRDDGTIKTTNSQAGPLIFNGQQTAPIASKNEATRLWFTIDPEQQLLVFGPPEHRFKITPEQFKSVMNSIEGKNQILIEYRAPDNRKHKESVEPPEWVVDQAFHPNRVRLLTLHDK